LAAIKTELGISDDDFVRYFAEEKAYLDGLKDAPIFEQLKIQYVEALNDLFRFR
jgi:hypothetical protein